MFDNSSTIISKKRQKLFIIEHAEMRRFSFQLKILITGNKPMMCKKKRIKIEAYQNID